MRVGLTTLLWIHYTMAMSIRTIVFDFGNVIGFFDHRRATRVLAQHTVLPEQLMYAHVYDPQLEDDYESGRVSSEEFLRRIRKAGQFSCTEEHIGAAYCDIFWHNEEVCELVPRLRPRYRLLLGSNTTELHSRRFREQFAEVLAHFDHLVLSHDVGARKPRREFFEYCQQRAHCEPGECLFIDDLPVNVAGARACGWQGIIYQPGGQLRDELASLGVQLNGAV
ncbi:MAG: HAD family phosphatase [Gemmataceae bacterium]|nr:HAD family phosphatase [Gemmataceae bacterium]